MDDAPLMRLGEGSRKAWGAEHVRGEVWPELFAEVDGGGGGQLLLQQDFHLLFLDLAASGTTSHPFSGREAAVHPRRGPRLLRPRPRLRALPPRV